MEFHISRRARDRYQFDEALFSLSGNVVLANFHAARIFAQRMNSRRDVARFPETAIRAGQVNAMGLLDELAHRMVALYREQRNPAIMQQALAWLEGEVGAEAVEATLRRFAEEFPPLPVYRRQLTVEEYLQGQTDGTPNRQILLEELLMLWLANANPAFSPFRELFDDAALAAASAYPQIVSSLQRFFQGQPSFGPDEQDLLSMLRSPALASPHSLSGQLEYVRERWGILLGRVLYRLLGSLDLIQEEQRPVFAGPGPAPVYEFRGLEAEPEHFSPDLHWMPRLVLLAKNAYVWLHQLSQRYRRLISRLDQIPDEELETLARWGFTGLWLIGLWERSPASARIKQLCGNPEAVASAYSLYDYQVAADLGGQPAFQDLRDRAWRYGIRLASDMVPNHVGIYSRWVVEHPDWFVSLKYSPFPSYRYSGPDLSADGRVGIFLEDHYYDRSDASVVFKRVDRWTGDERYIYHGNDGTSMPWNDTAQLNYLNPEVREAVIQTILHVARQTPIIRFDAAMTLTKRHYQRLWFPEPGSGGAIPTRAEHGLTKAEFDAAMPNEFWREVVDRVAAEAPDTLLLAEAFWLLEGYFVRTLGMHRVYNSAFMHMLRDEDNAKYRQVIKNTLEFDPEILKRYVNFMNNPDEETAVGQFGKGDKYFGICTLLATLPGLPMFGHGQVEGLAERYGMEYRRAYWDEQPDDNLIRRHERQIFPLLHRRSLFAEVEHFRLYDFVTDGAVNEDVFAYSNRRGDERALVVYHNRYATTRGRIRTSVPYPVKTGQGDVRRLEQTSLGQGLGLQNDPARFCIFRDHVTGLEYLRSSQEICRNGLYVELDAYRCHVFVDWREVQDNERGHYAQLNALLDGRGVPSIEGALRELFLQPVHLPFRALVNAEAFSRLAAVHGRSFSTLPERRALLDEIEEKAVHLLSEVRRFATESGPQTFRVGSEPTEQSLEAIAAELRRKLEVILDLDPLEESSMGEGFLPSPVVHRPSSSSWGTLLGWAFLHLLGKAGGEEGFRERSLAWMDEWLLGRLLAAALQDLGLDEGAASRAVGLVKILIRHQEWYQPLAGEAIGQSPLTSWLQDAAVHSFLQVNRYEGVLWFNKECFEELLSWMLLVAAVEIGADPALSPERAALGIKACRDVIRILYQAEQGSGYRLETLQEAAQQEWQASHAGLRPAPTGAPT